MAWYRDGTVRVTNGSATVTGIGTLWGDNKQGIGPGQMLLVPAAGTVQVYEILRVDSNTQLTLKDNFVGATAGSSVYAIPSFYTDSVPDFARRLSAQLSYYQSQMDGWQQIMTGTGSITLTTPNGQTVTISSFKKLTDDMSLKADSSSLGTAAKKNTGSSFGDVLTVGTSGLADQAVEWNGTAGSGFNRLSSFPPSTDTSYNCVHMKVGGYACQIAASLGGMPRLFVRNTLNGGSDLGWRECYTTGNTTKATDGTLKAASPIVKIFTDGRSETNDESDGCTVKRLDVGKYLIEGCIGMNADASWGGIDGGFDIPKDRNGQQLIWLDYDVHADGSILVKTFHRTYPEAPAFAQNLIGYRDQETGAFVETVHTGNAVDIPADQFVSVRVEMPTNGKDAAANDIKAAIEEAILEEKSHEQGS